MWDFNLNSCLNLFRHATICMNMILSVVIPLQYIPEEYPSDEKVGEHQSLSLHLSHHFDPAWPQHHPCLQHKRQPHKTVRHWSSFIWNTLYFCFLFADLSGFLRMYAFFSALQSCSAKAGADTYVAASLILGCIVNAALLISGSWSGSWYVHKPWPVPCHVVGSSYWMTSTPTTIYCFTLGHVGSPSGWTSWLRSWPCWWRCL